MRVSELSTDLYTRTKRSFTTRRVPATDMKTLITGDVAPNAGDLVLACVDKIGSHAKLELPTGRRAQLSVGDLIIVTYGNRYAPDQFEAVIGGELSPCELVAAGGIASQKICKHARMGEPTRITPMGLVGTANGTPINLRDYAITPPDTQRDMPVVLVAGTSMNAGKTYTSASLIKGLSAAGIKTAGIKATGTGSGGDLWLMSDMGADRVLDFTDAGLASTYLAEPLRIEEAIVSLIREASASGCEVAVVEIADGLHHQETAEVLKSKRIRDLARGLIFAANDALGAQAGLAQLQDWGHDVMVLSGQLTRSPLAMREARRFATVPVMTADEIRGGALNDTILGHRSAAVVAFTRHVHVPNETIKVGAATGDLRPGLASMDGQLSHGAAAR
ncbi:MAG: DUF1611 domain-containing protein [Hyphomicrobiaceae bacterium]|nr:DUF1611 domain-containing protein [Hyphomicrobiaceae bacterium]